MESPFNKPDVTPGFTSSATQKPPAPFKIKTEVEVTAQQVANLITGAIEGGSTDWCRKVIRVSSDAPTERPWYASPNVWANDFKVDVTFDNPEAGPTQVTKTITGVDIQRGLQKLADDYASHWGDILQDEGDAFTDDAFFQCVVLGDITYG